MSIATRAESIRFRGQDLWVLRDDQAVLTSTVQGDSTHQIDGNKARKLYHYFQLDLPAKTRVISYGSVQSNMLYSLAVLCYQKGWQLEFFVHQIPTNLYSRPRGNYADALSLGAKVLELPKSTELLGLSEYTTQRAMSDTGALFIPEGGASAMAEIGIGMLADEIQQWVVQQRVQNPKVMLPSGTGTMAYYLQKHLPFEVLTCACVGDAGYLEEQMLGLEDNPEIQPKILSTRFLNKERLSKNATLLNKAPLPDKAPLLNKAPLPDKAPLPNDKTPSKFHFGKLYREFYQIWSELKSETGVTFDLLYDPLGWMCLLDYLDHIKTGENIKVPTVLYLHQGGLRGNTSMLARYRHQFELGIQADD